MGKVRNQTDSKLLLKGRNTLEVCEGLLDWYSLQVDGHLFIVLADRHYDNISDSRKACLDLPTLSGEFDLAIVDSWLEIGELRAFLSSLPGSKDIWLYIGGESGFPKADPANKWTQTKAVIAQNLWYDGEPDNPDELCVVIAETLNGLLDAHCSGRPVGPGQDVNTLCEYFPHK